MSALWLEQFKIIGANKELREFIKLDTQLAMLQKIDDEKKNCLHKACAMCDFGLIKLIANQADYLTAEFQRREEEGNLIPPII